MLDLKSRLIEWLKTKSNDDIVYVKNNPAIIFSKHPGMSNYDAEKLVEEPDKIHQVKADKSHNDRLDILKIYSRKYDMEYIILDPFNQYIEEKYKEKVAIVTFFPTKRQP